MKRKIMIASVIGCVIFGGAIGANAISNTNSQVKEANSKISLEKAAEIAKNEVGGIVESVELDKENGRLIYEVDFVEDDLDVDIDAVTGEVVKVDRDDDRAVVKQSKTISKEEAISIALKDTPGVVTEVDFDSDDHEYEIEIQSEKQEIELTIDAATGNILNKDFDD
ncbi:PepSY domain-containing protein [Bacillus sp. FJAT-50079]|uniref:PepSY domain-containing protein n=1 Tax=Bacillus sp. FJAT-50079 TaxID=2833577 RepID=UPI001BC8F7A4|nr:PepSY domain-containing protein [Bacillus sp. FJAT-50079]MBS4208458.1 PepSY domain-containing protein [Bacillus sp. FJAT-50079]